MKVKIGYNQLVFVDLSEEQESDLEKLVGYVGELKEGQYGWIFKAEKATMFDLLCKLSYKYDLEVM